MLTLLVWLLSTTTPPTVLRTEPVDATVGTTAQAVLTAADPEGVLTATPCAAEATCSGAQVTVPLGKVALRLWRPGQHPVAGPVEVKGDARVTAPPTPDQTIERAAATTGVALGAALILTSVLVVGLDAEHDTALRVALPIATGLGSVALAGGALWLRALGDEAPKSTATLELVSP